MKARLILEDGLVFYGTPFTNSPNHTVFAELVFNTAMTGYEEVLTDPSYKGQMVAMTYPLVGSYGVDEEHAEGKRVCIEALLIREYIDLPSGKGLTLANYLNQHQIMGVQGIGTRALVRHLRNFGVKKAVLTTANTPQEQLITQLQQWEMPHNLAETVGAADIGFYPAANNNERYRVAIIDTGTKYNIIRLLQQQGCACTLLPPNIAASYILTGNFDGVLVANGPGNPHHLPNLVQTIGQLLGKIPFWGICLGHQLLGLALGLAVVKLKFGHHGVNHPVKNLLNGKVEITSHNHNYAIAIQSLQQQPDVQITHLNLLDGTIAGISHRVYPAFSVQYHPEAAPGPLDSQYLFEQFTTLMRNWQISGKG